MKENLEIELAKKEKLNIEDMVYLCSSKDAEVRILMAQRPDLHPTLIEKLSKDDSSQVVITIAQRSDLLEHQNIIDRLLKKGFYFERQALVDNPIFNGKEDWLFEKYETSHYAIAGRNVLPTHLQEKLALDKNEYIRAEIATRHDLLPHLFLKLLLDEESNVREQIVNRLNFLEEIKPFLKLRGE